MIRRITAIAFALTFIPFASVLADDLGTGTVIKIDKQSAVEQDVSAPPPPFVEFETTAIAAGLGARIGDGTLLVEGQEHPFPVRGVSIGDFGVSRISGEGTVANLENVADFEGHYVAFEVGAAAGVGASRMTMRNEKGVVITLESKVKGLQLTLGAQGLDVELQ